VSKFLKVLKYLAIGLVLLVAAVVTYDQLRYYLWKPPTSLHGISLGMSRSDVVFALGDDDNCVPSGCSYSIPSLWVQLENDRVSYINGKTGYVSGSKWDSIYPPFKTTEEMKDIFGDEDILAISKDLTERRYTYVKYGVTFSFSTNVLKAIAIGEVRWRSHGEQGEYLLRGKQICPSPECPWEEDGKTLKPEYEDKSYRDFFSD